MTKLAAAALFTSFALVACSSEDSNQDNSDNPPGSEQSADKGSSVTSDPACPTSVFRADGRIEAKAPATGTDTPGWRWAGDYATFDVFVAVDGGERRVMTCKRVPDQR